MPQVTCTFCGLPFSVRKVAEGADHFCCSGCALASRIPMRDENLPLSRELVVALALGFGLFNQVLFGVLGAAVSADGRMDVGLRLTVIAVVIGALLAVVCVGFLFTTPGRRWTDAAVGALAVSLVAWAVWCTWNRGVAGATAPLLLANVTFALWWSRGWLRRIVRRRRPAT